ncbi:MAG: single-stranded DNA-binding protein [Oscillospiraceae bacterium]|nr:single-stranded DNA-binding protein [Oscillospiraceae bacterium]
MAQALVFGRVTADFEVKLGAKQNPYVRFDIAENIGRGQYARTQFWQVVAFGHDAESLGRAKVKKGSLVWIAGGAELESFVKRDGITKDKRLKLMLNEWGFVPNGRAKDVSDAPKPVSEDNAAPQQAAIIDGEREPLPG